MRAILCFLLLISLAGCGGTAYQPMAFSGGYEDMQLDANIYRVRFAGNGGTRPERAEDFALLRSAELAIEKGYPYFMILESNARTTSSLHSIPQTSTTTYRGTSYGNNFQGTATTTTSGGNTFVINKPNVALTILLLKERPGGPGLVYEAENIRNNIRGRYGL